MQMKEVCKITGIPKRTIHFYIEEKLIIPTSNPENKYYEFSETDCKILIFIKELRNAGISITDIRSMIQTPATAGYYINRQMKKLKKEKTNIEQTIISLKYILDELPLFPEFSSLYDLCINAKIPSASLITENTDGFDNYNTFFINQLLWGHFIPKTKFTEFQEFLWMKLNKETFENPTEEYIKICQWFNNLPTTEIDKMVSFQTTRYEYIASLDEDGINQCVQDKIKELESLLSNYEIRTYWKEMYDNYFLPATKVQVSKYAQLVIQISPFYNSYVNNINAVCQKTYDYLMSDEGKPLFNKLNNYFHDQFDIENYNHGQLETLTSVAELL